MDGTGKLFKPFIDLLENSSLANAISYEVVCLNDIQETNYQLIAQKIADQFCDEEVIILAESYSGRIAYELCQLPNLKIKHVIFVASFLARPSFISRFASIIPVQIIRSLYMPKLLLSLVFFSSINIELVNSFLHSIKDVSDDVLKTRLKNIASLETPQVEINIPCTYLQASRDLLVSRNAVKLFNLVFKDISVKRVKSGHFLVQCCPKSCLKVLLDVFGV